MDRNLELKQQIAKNIKNLMKSNGLTQVQLSEKSGISKSTISDYMRCKTLINAGNVEKIAMVFNVDKSAIDPTFKKKTSNVSEVIAAHIDDDATEEEIEEILAYIETKRMMRKNRKK
ncbi:helix-turn-helix domain-containing protein [Staphylococcus succinus]|uniref:helix-turn-helix domain-containing protein n=1 Tax=Staphylococcus succinus TaxID=61015 RepID=UPI001C04C2EB|nr:helix-turn-helix transcriptional regulator [Staphylococcus succinus]MBU0437797.1 helix-turn-helix domain-containing protein [Staphylococcus succinus]